MRLGLCPALALSFACAAVNPGFGKDPAVLAAVAPQTDSESLFNEAVDAYNHNLFTQAVAKFKQVSGPHAPEAQQYISKINAYQDAIQVAKSAIDRSPDEQDPKSLAYAIQQLQNAINIKADGPWNPNEMLARARDLKTQIEKAHTARSKAMAAEYCAKAQAAASEHRYKMAAQFICAVANDSPGYSCAGDEALHLCAVDTDLAKFDKVRGTTEPEPIAAEPAQSGNLDAAKAAFDKNDFERARGLFERAGTDSKAEADQYLEKISRYTDAMASAEKASHDGQYDEARTSFLAAVAIKPDGPGDPQTRASAMELFLGVDKFYSGDYTSAIQHLQSCSRTGSPKQALVHFYLGASELAKFFVTGGEDVSLHQDALNDLRQAKQAGFKASAQEISPKILQVYNDLSF